MVLILLSSAVMCEELSFEEFLNSGLEHSYQLKKAELDKSISQKGIGEAKSEYLPTLSAYAVSERYNDLTNGQAQITAIGNEIFLNRNYYQDAAALMLTYNVFDFGIRKRQLDIAKADSTQKEYILEKDTSDLKLDLVDLYAQTLSLYKEINIKKNVLDVHKELNEISKRLKEAGKISEIDVIDSEIQISELKTQIEDLSNNFSKKLIDMSFYTNKEYSADSIQIKDFSKDDNTFMPQNGVAKLSAEVITLTPENSPDNFIYDLEILKKKKEYEIQKRYNYPKIKLDSRYSLYGSDTNSLLDAFSDVSQRSFSVRLTATMTLFDGLKNRNKIAKAKYEIEKAKIEKEQKMAELKVKYEQIQLDAKNAAVQEENIVKTLALVNKNLNLMERLNFNGLSDKSECLKRKLTLLNKKLDLEENQIKLQTSQYKLKVLCDKNKENI